MLPAFEFWITGYALIPAVALFFASILGVLGAGPALTKSFHKRIAWAGVAVIAVLTWWQLAKKEEQNAKPERDYAYLMPSKYVMPNSLIFLSTISTGTLRNARIAVRRVGSDNKPESVYIYSNGIDGVTIDEGTNLSAVALPTGSYAIDIDPPTRFGKVDERLTIEKTDSAITGTIVAVRKWNREVLFPAPETISLTHKLLVLFFASQFLLFVSALAWGSWVTT